jgi:hypothetical protein
MALADHTSTHPVDPTDPRNLPAHDVLAIGQVAGISTRTVRFIERLVHLWLDVLEARLADPTEPEPASYPDARGMWVRPDDEDLALLADISRLTGDAKLLVWRSPVGDTSWRRCDQLETENSALLALANLPELLALQPGHAVALARHSDGSWSHSEPVELRGGQALVVDSTGRLVVEAAVPAGGRGDVD